MEVDVWIIISLIMRLVLASVANGLYINHAKKKINKIKSMETDENVIAEKCRKKGGTSKIILIIFFWFIGFIFYIMFQQSFNTNNMVFLDTIGDKASKRTKLCIVVNKKSNYYSKDYTTGGKNENTFINLNFKIPKETLFACSDETKNWKR